MTDDTVFTTENIPDDAEFFNKKPEFKPIDPAEIYQVQIVKIELKTNSFYREKETDPSKQGSKYQFSFEFAILNDGEFRGRRLWDNTGLAFKPESKKGPTKLFKIVVAALNKVMTWDDVSVFAPDLKTFYQNLLKDILNKQVRVGVENVMSPETNKIKTKIRVYNPVKEELPPIENVQSDAPANTNDIPF